MTDPSTAKQKSTWKCLWKVMTVLQLESEHPCPRGLEAPLPPQGSGEKGLLENFHLNNDEI